MSTIEILNPKALKLIQGLAELELISINQTKQTSFSKILENLRSKADSAPSVEEISDEVESVRSARYEQKK